MISRRAVWLSSIPDQVADLTSRWDLALGPVVEAIHGTNSWVAQVTRVDGSKAVLKIGMPHFESDHEIDGLLFWNGDGAVRLLESDPATGAMLLERCEPGNALRQRPEPEQDEVIARLLRRLWRVPPDPHPFRPLWMMTDLWVRESAGAAASWGDTCLVQEGLAMLKELPRDATDAVLLATDLHAGNVLSARREPWLVIDPKPFLGDRAYDATQHLLNCRERVMRDWRGTIGRLADLLEVDQERVRLWLFARAAAEPRDDWRNDELSAVARVLTRN